MRVERTNPMITFGEPSEPPEPPGDAEMQRLQAQVAVYGSAIVWEMVIEFSEAVRKFFIASSMLDIARKQPHGSAEGWEKLEERRREVRDVLVALREQVQQEVERL